MYVVVQKGWAWPLAGRADQAGPVERSLAFGAYLLLRTQYVDDEWGDGLGSLFAMLPCTNSSPRNTRALRSTTSSETCRTKPIEHWLRVIRCIRYITDLAGTGSIHSTLSRAPSRTHTPNPPASSNTKYQSAHVSVLAKVELSLRHNRGRDILPPPTNHLSPSPGTSYITPGHHLLLVPWHLNPIFQCQRPSSAR